MWCDCSVCVLVMTVSCAKMAESIEMPFGEMIQVGRRNYMWRLGVQVGATWQICLNNLSLAAMRAVAIVTIATRLLGLRLNLMSFIGVKITDLQFFIVVFFLMVWICYRYLRPNSEMLSPAALERFT